MSTMYHPDDLPYPNIGRLHNLFTPFREKVEKEATPRNQAPTPNRGDLPLPASKASLQSPAASFDALPSLSDLGIPEPVDDPRAVMRFQGGETAALARLKHYLWDTDCLAKYFETRNGMIGPDYSSKFSPWLAHGCLSPTLVAEECAKYEHERVKNKSTYWLVFELLWRDFFRFFALKHDTAIFLPGGIAGEHPEWTKGHEAEEKVRRWKAGQTGLPLVDANMRELAATGFMSNRGRQNVASYLALDLNIDWRIGADHFESLLLDYDVASNWGNWIFAAGLTGKRVSQFNIVKQSKDYDPNGEYARLWCPELAKVPNQYIHTPWEMPPDVQERSGVRIGEDYPAPLAIPPGYAFGGGGRAGGRGGGGRGSSGGRSLGAPAGKRPQGAYGNGRGGGGGGRRPRGGRVQHYHGD